jgi:hypothetical protein
VKVTLIAQLDPGATEVPQLLVCPKSLPFVPATTMLIRFNDALPELASVTT